MPSITIDMRQLGPALKKFVAYNEEAAVRAAQKTMGKDALRAVQREIRRARPRPFDTGEYAQGWHAHNLPKGAMIYNSSQPPVKAAVIESGRRAAWIPIKPLAEWVHRKLGVSDAAEARGIAFAISKKASTTPRPGLHILEKAQPSIVEAWKTNLARELRKAQRGGK